MKTIKYADLLNKDLKKSKEAVGYLNACLEEAPDVFLIALKDVIMARGGFSKFSKSCGLNRENLYRLLSKKGNPRLDSLLKITRALGLELMLSPGKTKRAA